MASISISYYPCPYCGATFTTMAALTSHIEEMQGIGPHPPAPPVYYCPYCGATFSSQAALDAHIASAHPPPVYPCPYCGATFSSQAALEAHIASAHPPPVFPCPICGAEFSTADALFRHMDVAHPPPTTYRLDIFVPSWAYGGYVEPGSGDYPADSTVKLTAYPLSGYQFLSWGRDASGTSLTYNLYMDSDKNVEAYFEKVPVPEYKGKISKKELEYDETRGAIPVY